jgi:RNA polymerase sigma factor (TIGR02999 family)
LNTAASIEITQTLKAWSAGDDAALHRLMPRVFDELRKMARRYARQARAGHSMQSSDLVNEVYLRLVDINNVTWQDRAHFFAVAAQLMRRIVIDAARARACAKRGGGLRRVDYSGVVLDRMPEVSSKQDSEIIAINDALNQLAKMDPRKAQVIELRFFGGLSVEETSEVMKIGPQTIMREWNLAKAWMLRELSQQG